jgi:hypothetical protein
MNTSKFIKLSLVIYLFCLLYLKKQNKRKKKSVAFSPQANYTY